MVEAGPQRIHGSRPSAGGPVFWVRRRQPVGWSALLFSVGLHGAVFAALAWLTFGGQGHEGHDGMEDNMADAATASVPVLQTQPRHNPSIPPRKVVSFAPANTPRLLSVSPTASMMLPKWEMAPTRPLQAVPPAAAPATPARTELAAESKSTGTATRTKHKATGKGAGSGMGSARVNVRPPQLVSSYPPPYPEKARREQIEGTTVVRVTVSGEGQVLSCSIHRSAGDQGLDTAALRAVKGWRFTPAMTGAADVLVHVTFRLS